MAAGPSSALLWGSIQWNRFVILSLLLSVSMLLKAQKWFQDSFGLQSINVLESSWVDGDWQHIIWPIEWWSDWNWLIASAGVRNFNNVTLNSNRTRNRNTLCAHSCVSLNCLASKTLTNTDVANRNFLPLRDLLQNLPAMHHCEFLALCHHVMQCRMGPYPVCSVFLKNTVSKLHRSTRFVWHGLEILNSNQEQCILLNVGITVGTVASCRNGK